MSDTFLGVFDQILNLLLFCVKAIVIAVAPFLIMLCFWFVYFLIKGKRIRKRTVPITDTKYSKPLNFLIRFFVLFPKQIVLDKILIDPDVFDTFGVHMFCGEQGSGKSIAMIHFVKMIKERNPLCKIASNISIDFQDDNIYDWQDILNLNNGIYGQVVILDEIQNWFSSNESKNFPPEMLTEITQQRKQRKIIVGTSQVFTRMSKPIREQCTVIYKPITIFGCFTIVRAYKPSLNDEGSVENMRLLKTYCFVHDDELRNSFDTFEKVQRQSVSGFKPRDQQLSNTVIPTIPNIDELKKQLK